MSARKKSYSWDSAYNRSYEFECYLKEKFTEDELLYLAKELGISRFYSIRDFSTYYWGSMKFFESPLEDMPLYINDQSYEGTIARFRLKHGK